MKAVILAGGLGTRISEETHLRPKPMIEIGGKPILWHILKMYSAHGVNDFVICCGYKGYIIKEYFANYFLHMSDVTFDMVNNRMEVHHKHAEPWMVTLVDTGDDSMTGGRLRRVADYVKDELAFCFTYGDGVSDVDISASIAFHHRHGKLATVTAVQPPGRYGALSMQGQLVQGFTEKPRGDGGLINGGFFVLSPQVLARIAGDTSSWEGEPLASLAAEGQLMAYEHTGFWQPMDTLREKNLLEELWLSGKSPVENVVMWTNTPVFLTGHTGFKGGWLALWLHALGAKVHGYALDPNTTPNLFDIARVDAVLASDTRADLADSGALQAALSAAQPTVVFHLAAQPLVRASYADPLGTFATNIMGTAHLLEAVRSVPSVRAVVVVTTDKVYDNREWVYPYRESDALGGHDPYSASKGAAEIVTASYRASFFHTPTSPRIATARAGNVVGGGDWAADRLVPDCLKAFANDQPVHLRYPGAVRPWQHVLEPLSGYLRLAEALLHNPAAAGAWNFGPDARGDATVGQVAQRLAALWGPGARVDIPEGGNHPHEANQLRLDITRARAELGWQPRWSLEDALDGTIAWHRAWLAGADMAAISRSQIAAFGGT